MKAMIFAAGEGTRLRPLTLTTPKALVTVAGVPMLERVINSLTAVGVDKIVVNVHHLAGQIRDFLGSRRWDAEIAISDESDRLLDTGGGLLKAAGLLDGKEPIIVHNADIVTDVDLPAMLRHHLDSGAEATLLVADRQSSRKLAFDNGMKLTGRAPVGASSPEAYAFNCIHIIEPRLLAHLSRWASSDVFSITDFYVSGAADVRGYVSPDPYTWFDIGSPQKLAQAEQSLSHSNLAPIPPQ